MNDYIQIKSDITPENLEAKVREFAHQVAAAQMRSMLSAHRAASLHGLRPPHGVLLKGLPAVPAYRSLAKAPKAVSIGGSMFPLTPAQEAVRRITDIRLRAFLKR